METLPLETLQEILDWLPLEDQPTPRLTCKLFSQMIPRTPEFQRHLGLVTDDPKLVSQVVSRKPEFRTYICYLSAKQGSLKVLKWARANDCPWNMWTCAHAARNGHPGILQWARANGCPWNSWTYTYDMQNGYLEVLQWTRTNGCPWNSQEYLELSAYHPQIQEWIRQNM